MSQKTTITFNKMPIQLNGGEVRFYDDEWKKIEVPKDYGSQDFSQEITVKGDVSTFGMKSYPLSGEPAFVIIDVFGMGENFADRATILYSNKDNQYVYIVGLGKFVNYEFADDGTKDISELKFKLTTTQLRRWTLKERIAFWCCNIFGKNGFFRK